MKKNYLEIFKANILSPARRRIERYKARPLRNFPQKNDVMSTH